ncbi:MAG: hypothetical protein K8823_818 [Cenarchaeum symbiont of Oopsacas minuta]|nr:hypothetical protein [Cenarchaeum symbiont of Oopsacas minuta]
MARYMIHLVNDGYVPNNAKQLLGDARQMCSGMNIIIRDCRVSQRCVEFDVTLNAKTTDELIERISPIGSLENAKLVTEEYIPKNDAIKLGVDYFNTERFWECHEVLEGVWKICKGQEKDLVQGIILVAAAFVHHQKFEDGICSSIFGRALEKLGNYNEYYGIDIRILCSTITSMRKSGNVEPFLI